MKYIVSLCAILCCSLNLLAQTLPPFTMHRLQDTTKNSQGYYYAKSTEGNFSVLLPIPFNDYTIKEKDVIVYCIGSKSQEGIKFSVTEMPKFDKAKVITLDGFVNNMKSADNVISNIKKKNTAVGSSVMFTVMDKSKGAIIKYYLTATRIYFSIIEFPIAYRKTVENDFGYFFTSLHVTK